MKPEIPAGLKAKVVHRRYVEGNSLALFTDQEIRSDGMKRRPKGGLTEAFIVDEKGDPLVVGTKENGEPDVAEGIALCSLADNYNRRIGRDIAVGRALKKLGVIRLKGV